MKKIIMTRYPDKQKHEDKVNKFIGNPKIVVIDYENVCYENQWYGSLIRYYHVESKLNLMRELSNYILKVGG